MFGVADKAGGRMIAYGIICNGCGKQFDVCKNRLFIGWKYMRDCAKARGWHYANDKKHYCPECSNRNIGVTEVK
jgi:hypothetical protein